MLFLFQILIFFLAVWIRVECLVVIPERANVTEFSKDYLSNIVFNVRRHGRKSPYLMNVFGTTLQAFNNSHMVDVIFSQFLHNEYRRSFVEWHYKFCDMINDEPFIGRMLKKTGLICPLPPGEHYYMNMTVPTQDFKYVFPFEKGRVELILSVLATKQVILHLFADVIFKQNIHKN